MGRHEGITRLQSNPLGLHGVHNDGAKTPQAVKKEAPQDALRHQFRTQSLRNISATAPYMHDGRFERLADALQHPLPVDAGHNAPKREPLSATQVQDLEAFLRTLSDSYGPNRPWPSVAQSACP